MVYIPDLPRRERMAIASASGTAIRVTLGVDRRLGWPARIAALAEDFDGQRIPDDRRPVLLGIMLGISRANSEEREILARLLYGAAGADEAVAAEQEAEHRAWLSGHRGGPRH